MPESIKSHSKLPPHLQTGIFKQKRKKRMKRNVAANLIQANYRGYKVRQEIGIKNKAAKTIQSQWHYYQLLKKNRKEGAECPVTLEGVEINQNAVFALVNKVPIYYSSMDALLSSLLVTQGKESTTNQRVIAILTSNKIYNLEIENKSKPTSIEVEAIDKESGAVWSYIMTNTPSGEKINKFNQIDEISREEEIVNGKRKFKYLLNYQKGTSKGTTSIFQTYTSYIGEFVVNGDILKHGKGLFEHCDYIKYKGKWEFDKKQGQFDVYFSNGVKETHIYKDDNLVKVESITSKVSLNSFQEKYLHTASEEASCPISKKPLSELFSSTDLALAYTKSKQQIYSFTELCIRLTQNQKCLSHNEDITHVQTKDGLYRVDYANPAEIVLTNPSLKSIKIIKDNVHNTISITLGGDYINSKLEGVCKLIYTSNGFTYTGMFISGKFHGEGIMTYPYGSFYNGNWRDNKRDGLGTFTTNDGNIYNGNWRDNKRDGLGTFTTKDGNIYKGLYKNNNKVFGTFTYKNGAVYEGAFKDDLFHGEGTYQNSRDDVYSGEWRSGKKHGQGIEKYKNGNVYQGNWVDNKFDGFGTYTCNKGTNYTGTFKDDLYDGQGTYRNIHGGVYRGKWKSGKKYGQGIYKTLGGAYQEKGEFLNNKLWNGHKKILGIKIRIINGLPPLYRTKQFLLSKLNQSSNSVHPAQTEC